MAEPITNSAAWRAVLGRLSAAGVALLVLLSVASAAAAASHWFDLATHFRVHYTLAALAGLLLLAVARFWRWALVAGLVFAVQGTAVWPYLAPALTAPLTATATATTVPDLRVLHANVLTSNDQFSALVELIARTEPNIVVLQETDNRWMNALASLGTVFPHRLGIERADNFGLLVLSRWPDTALQEVTLVPGGTPAIAAQIPTRQGTVHLLTMHPVPPLGAGWSAARNRHLAAAGELLGAWPDRKLLIGDLNITPWSPHFQSLLDAGGLADSRRWRMLGITWPSFAPLLGLPIDHALGGDGLALQRLERHWLEGSDHAALFSVWSLVP